MPPRRKLNLNPRGGGPIPPLSLSKSECKFYKQGACRKGESCHFLHLARIEPPANAAPTTSNDTVESTRAPPILQFINVDLTLGPGETTIPTRPAAPVAETSQSQTSKVEAQQAQSQATPKWRTRHDFQMAFALRRPNSSFRKPQKQQGVGSPAATPSLPGPPELPPVTNSQLLIQPIRAINVLRPADKHCFAWQRGLCERGDRCRYKHDPEVRHSFSQPLSAHSSALVHHSEGRNRSGS